MEGQRSDRSAWVVAFWMALGYVGVYLCRKNLAVALPLLGQEYGASKAALGTIASIATVFYAAGKFASGPLIDRLGGRAGFLLSLSGVALFGALGALAPELGALAPAFFGGPLGLWALPPALGALTVTYSLTRFAGAGGWSAMMKVASSWFPAGRLATAIALLSLSYVLGDAAAKSFADRVAALGGGWRAIMGSPSAALLLILLGCWLVVRQGAVATLPTTETATPPVAADDAPRRYSLPRAILALIRRPQFLILCLLSFVLTLVREAFNTWSVDYLFSLQVGEKSVGEAALRSMGFDLAGAVPILLMGLGYDRVRPAARRFIVFGALLLLSLALAILASIGPGGASAAGILLMAVGLLLYGPYSILGGVVTLETGGTRLAATAVGIVDGTGYLAAILAGQTLGAVLDRGGYHAAFLILAGLALIASLVSLALRDRPPAAARAA